jgi:hypothetical protein
MYTSCLQNDNVNGGMLIVLKNEAEISAKEYYVYAWY